MTAQTRGLSIAVLLIVSVALLGTYAAIRRMPPRLRANLVVEKADIGIPGVTKMYHADLTNRGLCPVWVTRCDFISDASVPGTELGYELQRWDLARKIWVKGDYSNSESFCRPYPLGIVSARLNGGWLWPGGSLSTNEEATAGRDTTHIGDRIRFLVFTAAPGDYSHSEVTQEAVIDEASTSDVPLRLSH